MINADNNKKSIMKSVIIAIFMIEQVVIIYIIATRKGISFVDWIVDLLT